MNEFDPTDDLLARSAPRTTTVTPELREELTRMAVASESEQRRTGTRRRVAIGAGALAVALFAGAGAAAATGVAGWGPWAQDADAVYVYALPGGDACELRITFDDAATGQVAREILSDVDLGSVIDVDGVIAVLRAMPSSGGDEFGNTFDTGFGTEFYPSVDEEYAQAVGIAASQYLGERLTERGVAGGGQDMTWASNCATEFDGGR